MENLKVEDLKSINWRKELQGLIEQKFGTLANFIKQDSKLEGFYRICNYNITLTVGRAIQLEENGIKTAMYWLTEQNKEQLIQEFYNEESEWKKKN